MESEVKEAQNEILTYGEKKNAIEVSASRYLAVFEEKAVNYIYVSKL